VQPDTQYAKSGDVNIAYQVLGDGPGDLVLVPGWISNIEVFWDEPLASRFLMRLASFSRLILFDKRGTGLSDRVADMPSLEVRMDDVRAVMDKVGSKQAALFGYSEGGAMCALFAATYPQRTLALIMNGAFGRRRWAPDYPWGINDAQFQVVLDDVLREWGTPYGIESRIPSMANDARFRHWWARYMRMSASPMAAATLQRMNGEIDVRQILSAIRIPTLVLHSIKDQICSIEAGRDLAHRIPGSRLVELHGIDHVPYGCDANIILDEVQEFITGVRHHDEVDRVLATVLFTDIVGATAKAASLGDRQWHDLLDSHHALVRRELLRFRGREIDTAGDGFVASFDGPARAIRCACSIADGVRVLGIEVRAGLHTGECEVIDQKLGGISVHIGARVAAVAEPGEVLVSSTVKDLVAGSGLSFQDRESTLSRACQMSGACLQLIDDRSEPN